MSDLITRRMALTAAVLSVLVGLQPPYSSLLVEVLGVGFVFVILVGIGLGLKLTIRGVRRLARRVRAVWA